MNPDSSPAQVELKVVLSMSVEDFVRYQALRDRLRAEVRRLDLIQGRWHLTCPSAWSKEEES